MTWARSTIGIVQLLTELATTAASALILRPVARVLQLVDDAHDVDEPADRTAGEHELTWCGIRLDTDCDLTYAELSDRTYPACTGTADCPANSAHMLCCQAPR